MRTLFIYLLLVISGLSIAQNTYGYRIDGSDIVFDFNVQHYEKVTIDQTNIKLEINDIKINKVVVAGTFNNWKGTGWMLQQMSDSIFELRKKVKDLNTDAESSFKFLINDKFWVEPPPFARNVSKVNISDLFEDVFNLNVDEITTSKNGNHTFYLKGFSNAKKVIVSGSFNNWNEHKLHMRKDGDLWRLQVDLPPGDYQYRFIVDGRWMEDPANKNRVPNEHGEYNSVVSKKKSVTFKLKNTDYDEVFLAGSFCNWQHNKIKMELIDGYWTTSIPLSHGKFHYKFIADNNWMNDPENELKEYGEDDHLNSVVFVK